MLAVEKNVNPKWLLTMEKLTTKNLTMKNVVVESCAKMWQFNIGDQKLW
jgi:hypothetical protein